MTQETHPTSQRHEPLVVEWTQVAIAVTTLLTDPMPTGCDRRILDVTDPASWDFVLNGDFIDAMGRLSDVSTPPLRIITEGSGNRSITFRYPTDHKRVYCDITHFEDGEVERKLIKLSEKAEEQFRQEPPKAVFAF